MNKNEIKKALYRENPTAQFIETYSDIFYYIAILENGEFVYFNVPVSDIGSAKFKNKMEAKYLIRWMV